MTVNPPDPYSKIAVAVIEQALKDRYRMFDVLEFFRSPWFETLADLVGINPVAARERLGIKMK